MTRYFGKVCNRHPELNGERYVYEKRCVGCMRDRPRRKNTRPGTRYFGKICEKHPELKGERIVNNWSCVGCHREKRKKQTLVKYHNDPEWKERYLKQRAVLKAKWNRYAIYTATYRANKKQRTPVWADFDKMEEIYRIASDKGMTVDHYYPLNGATVSGLHVETNLRIIPQSENDSKGNKHPEDFYK